jgi:hypothetical protein
MLQPIETAAHLSPQPKTFVFREVTRVVIDSQRQVVRVAEHAKLAMISAHGRGICSAMKEPRQSSELARSS